ncbi:MAG: ribokinase, partial [Planctomycetota bacterium]|nr:ribokinase [Planctomycetota bacterium]
MGDATILVVGSANVDMIVRVPRLPAPGETVGEGQFLQAFGGKGANQAVAAARAGGRVAFLACVGDDAIGRAMVEGYAREGIDVGPILRASDAPTGTALILIDAKGENSIAVAPGANDTITPAHIDAAAGRIRAAAMIVLQMEIPAAAVNRVLEIAGEAGVPVLFNFAPAGSAAVQVSSAMTGLVVNETEAHALTGLEVSGVDEAVAAGRALLARGPRWVVVTLGREGACVVEAAGAFHIPARSVQAVDTTAAGDTFCGALAAAL